MKANLSISKIFTIISLLTIAFLTSGCITASIIRYNVLRSKAKSKYHSYEKNIIPSKTKKDNILGKLYVKEVVKDGAIVCTDTTCHYSINIPVIFLHYNIQYSYLKNNSKHQKVNKPSILYLENTNNIELYDGLIIEIIDNMELVKNGTYTYKNDDGETIIIPKVKIEKTL